jgi:hypothetical protein
MLHQLWFLLVVPGLPLGGLLLWMHATARKREQQFRRPFDDMLRPAGWSLQKRTADLWESLSEDMMLCMITAVAAWAVWLSKNDLFWTALILGLISCSFFILRAKSRVIKYWNHRLGLLGEQVVGLILDRLSSDSIRVFHDLEVNEPGKKPWNIDHVVLTPAGVFAIETKTRRKPKDTGSGEVVGHKVVYDGYQLLFPAPMKADRFGIDQAQRNATWLSDNLAFGQADIPERQFHFRHPCSCPARLVDRRQGQRPGLSSQSQGPTQIFDWSPGRAVR